MHLEQYSTIAAPGFDVHILITTFRWFSDHFGIIYNFFFSDIVTWSLSSMLQYGVNVKHQDYFADSPSAGLDPAARDEWV